MPQGVGLALHAWREVWSAGAGGRGGRGGVIVARARVCCIIVFNGQAEASGCMQYGTKLGGVDWGMWQGAGSGGCGKGQDGSFIQLLEAATHQPAGKGGLYQVWESRSSGSSVVCHTNAAL